jgi:hypothetical protein
MPIHLNDKLDQVWSNYPRFGIGISDADKHKAVAQTFTVNKKGVLAFVEMSLAEQFQDSSSNLKIDIRPVVEGLPADDSSIIYRLTIPHGLLPDPEDAEGTNEWFVIPLFPATPIQVTPGQQLAIVLRSAPGGFYGATGSVSAPGGPE